MINSRDIRQLRREVRDRAHSMIERCMEAKIDIIVTSTYRDLEAQDALFAQGRTQPGRIVTNARGGESFHNYGVAFDVVPVVGGKAIWNDAGLWLRIGEIGESVGLEWAGRWVRFREMPHFQYTGGLSLAEMRAEANRET